MSMDDTKVQEKITVPSCVKCHNAQNENSHPDKFPNLETYEEVKAKYVKKIGNRYELTKTGKAEAQRLEEEI